MYAIKPAIVLYARDITATRKFYEIFDLRFVEEQHRQGPVHCVHDFQGIVLEIYPLKSAGSLEPNDAFALVFSSHDFDKIVTDLELARGHAILVKTGLGEAAMRTASTRDPDGRLVRLIEIQPGITL